MFLTLFNAFIAVLSTLFLIASLIVLLARRELNQLGIYALIVSTITVVFEAAHYYSVFSNATTLKEILIHVCVLAAMCTFVYTAGLVIVCIVKRYPFWKTAYPYLAIASLAIAILAVAFA